MARDRAIPNGAITLRPWLAFLLRTLASLLLLGVFPVQGGTKDAVDYGTGLTVNLERAESEVSQVVEEVAANGIIRGTKEYNKDEYVTGAEPASASRLFPPWTGGGKVFYKIRAHAIDPRNFKDSSDVGTLAVRYVVMGQGQGNTVLRIDAIYVEDFRHVAHPSNGSVESSEYRDIQEHLDALALMKKETLEAQKAQREQARKKLLAEAAPGNPVAEEKMTGFMPSHLRPSSQAVPQQAPGQSLAEYVHELRRLTERLVKTPGAPLKSAPFHSASTLTTLPTGTEVLIVITSPYWYGVETHEGQHGWLPRDQLEQLP
jgi:hypothetical protein